MSKLSSKKRNALPDSDFVYPKERSFPIHDHDHGVAALRLAGKAPSPSRVRAAVYARYPDLKPATALEKRAFVSKVIRKMFKAKAPESNGSSFIKRLHPHRDDIIEIAGLGALASPYVAKMLGYKMPDKVTDTLEVGGLGSLMLPSAFAIRRRMLKRV